MIKPFLTIVLFVLFVNNINSQICFRDSINCIRLKENSVYDTVYNGNAKDIKTINEVFRRKNWLRVYKRVKRKRNDWSIRELESELITKYGLKEYAHTFDSITKAEPLNLDPLLLDVELIFDQRNCDLHLKLDTVRIIKTPKNKKRYLFLYTIRGQSFFKYKMRRRKLHSLRILAAYDRVIKDKRKENEAKTKLF